MYVNKWNCAVTYYILALLFCTSSINFNNDNLLFTQSGICLFYSVLLILRVWYYSRKKIKVSFIIKASKNKNGSDFFWQQFISKYEL